MRWSPVRAHFLSRRATPSPLHINFNSHLNLPTQPLLVSFFIKEYINLTFTLSRHVVISILNDGILNNYYFLINHILIMNLILILKSQIGTISTSDQNSSMPFLRNEFSKIFEDLFTVTLFTEITRMFDRTKNFKLKQKTWSWRSWDFETLRLENML